MSGVFNALTTAVSGINAQSDAFTSLSNNIANSQTVGYKATSTSFADYVAGYRTGNSESQAQSNTVQAVSVQHVGNAGTATKSSNPLALSVSGNGMFVTSKATGVTSSNSGQTIFSQQQYYTRNGDFSQDKKGYIVNTAGYYLQGYTADKTGTLSTTTSPLNVANIGFNPTMTTTLNFNAAIGKLPADNSNYTPQTFGTQATTTYDNSGNPHKISTQWKESDTNPLVWNMSIYDADGNGTIPKNNYEVTFDSSGSLASIKNADTGEQVSSTIKGTAAEIPFTAQYAINSKQTMNLNLGTIGGLSGTTMASSKSSPTNTESSPLTVSGTSLSLGGQTVLGTTTGSNQSYMTSPVEVGSSNTPVALKWTQNSASPPTWTVQAVNTYDSSSSSNVQSPSHTIVFNTNGTMKTMDGQAVSGTTTTSATIDGANYNIDISGAALTTNSTVSDNSVTTLTNDSVVTGNYTGASIESDGSVMAQFDNGYSQLIGKVAMARFNNYDGLQLVDGQAYTATDTSGSPQIGLVGANGVGTLAVGYTEASTTDLTNDLSALIVTQEAYSANTKTVTTADQMLQQTIAMKQ